MKGRQPQIAIVLTARTDSRRLHNKVLAEIEGKPLLSWVAQRLSEAGYVILAVPEKDPLAAWGKAEGLPVFEGSERDVTKRVVDAAGEFKDNADYVMRGLGDCPFIVPSIIKHVTNVMREREADSLEWVLPPFVAPVYGTREFPRSKHLWDVTNKEAVNDEREHPDLFYHRHRDRFKIVYHEPPAPLYFRPYRVEVDWKEDIELIRRVSKPFGRLPTCEEAIDYLDHHEDWKVNRRRSELTGPMASYSQRNRSQWWQLMRGQTIIKWDGTTIEYNDSAGEPVFCRGNHCLIGYTVKDKLYVNGIEIVGDAKIPCACGVGRSWFAAK